MTKKIALSLTIAAGILLGTILLLETNRQIAHTNTAPSPTPVQACRVYTQFAKKGK